MPPLDQPPDIVSAGMNFLDHIEELRRRLIKAVLWVIVMSGLAFYFSDTIIRFFIAPLGEVKLHVTDVTGSFYAYLKMSLVTGLLAGAPFVFYQLWSFVAPGLYPKERHAVLPMVLVSTLLFLAGASFCFYIVLPFALNFLIGFGGDLFSPIITVGSYISFAGMLLVAFGLSFQLPVVAYFLGRIGLVNAALLSAGRRYAVVIILIVSAILTPTPDVATQLMLAGPLYFLYEASIMIVRISGKSRRPAEVE